MPCPQPAQRRRSAPALAALAAVVFLAGCAGMDAAAGDAENRFVQGDGSSTEFAHDERDPAPQVSGETLDGESISLGDYTGRILVVNFWASWCAPCRAEKPVLAEVHMENADEGVEFLGVNIKDNRTAAETFESNLEVPYPSLYDQPGEVPQAFRETVPPQAIPSTLILDPDGRIAGRIIGAADYDTLSSLVESVVAETEHSQ